MDIVKRGINNNMERQSHGFNYQAEIIKRYDLIEDKNYTGKWDAYFEDIPVSIKCPRLGGDIELADFFRQSAINQDFYMIIGFHDDKYNIVEEYILYFTKEEWKKFFTDEMNFKFKELLNNCSNDHSYDTIWKEKTALLKKEWVQKTNNLIRPRFKRDHKTQKRIQCAINNKDFYKYFIPHYAVGVV